MYEIQLKKNVTPGALRLTETDLYETAKRNAVIGRDTSNFCVEHITQRCLDA